MDHPFSLLCVDCFAPLPANFLERGKRLFKYGGLSLFFFKKKKTGLRF